MVQTNRKVVEMIRNVTSKYHNATLYIATVVTIILILQIFALTKGLD